MTFAPQAALAVNHVGLTVPDIHAAIDWYGAVFGFRCIMGPRELEVTGHAEASSVFGDRFRRGQRHRRGRCTSNGRFRRVRSKSAWRPCEHLQRRRA